MQLLGSTLLYKEPLQWPWQRLHYSTNQEMQSPFGLIAL